MNGIIEWDPIVVIDALNYRVEPHPGVPLNA